MLTADLTTRCPVRICGPNGAYFFTIDLVPHGDYVFVPGIGTCDGRCAFDGDRVLIFDREVPAIADAAAKYFGLYSPRIERSSVAA